MMGVVVDLARYRRELERQRSERCDECGSIVGERVSYMRRWICLECERRLLAWLATIA
jgi:ribosomal protein L37AE/L43A